MWPHLRAGLIALAIALGLVEGCPLPPRGEAASWQLPIIDVVRPVQQAVLSPVAWIPRELRFHQRWALFQSADRIRYRLVIDARDRDGAEVAVHRAGEHGDDLLAYRRVRGAYNPSRSPPGQYRAFVRWYGDRLLARRPELAYVRFRMEQLDRGVPTGVHVFEVIRGRGDRR